MNNGQQFWLDLWQQDKTNFHRDVVNADLIKYWLALKLPAAASVLVPLCGKSLDMLWLAEQGFQVTGIELSEKAVLQFAEENHLSMTKKVYNQGFVYFNSAISIWVADFFSLPFSSIKQVDAIYDRAALIALPEKLRTNYVQRCLKWLKPGGKILLKTMHYDQTQMRGPPFSVSAKEVNKLYNNCQSVLCLSEATHEVDPRDHLHARGLEKQTDAVWLIQAEEAGS